MSYPQVPFLDAVKDVSAGNRRIPRSNLLPKGLLAVVDQGKGVIAGYTEDLEARVRPAPPLIVFGDHTRAVKYVDFPFAMGADGVKVLAARDGFDAKYVFRYLESINLPQAGYSRHFKFLKEVRIPQPPLNEQRRIAAILDHADALRAKRRQVLDHLDTLTRSIFHEMMQEGVHVTVNLGGVCRLFGGASLPAGVQFHGQSGGVLLMKVSDMNAVGNEHAIRTTAMWNSVGGPRSATVDSGAVVLPKRGASIATNKKRVTTRTTSLDPNLMGVQPDVDRLSVGFLYAWFQSFDLATIASGSAVPQINKQDLAPLRVPLPSLARQRRFNEDVGLVRRHAAAVSRGLVADDGLFSSLQSRAFRGEP